MKWVTPEVTSAFPLIVAAALIESGLVRSRNELQTLQKSLENWKANCFEDHPRLTRNERHMVALLEAFLLRGLREFVEDIEADQRSREE